MKQHNTDNTAGNAATIAAGRCNRTLLLALLPHADCAFGFSFFSTTRLLAVLATLAAHENGAGALLAVSAAGAAPLAAETVEAANAVVPADFSLFLEEEDLSLDDDDFLL